MSFILKKDVLNISRVFSRNKIHSHNNIQIPERYAINIDCNNCNCDIEFNIDIKNIFINSSLANKYKIINTIYEKYNKAAYIIMTHDTKYFLKIKHCTLINAFEKDIFEILKKYHHNNIIKCKHLTENSNYYFFIYEYIDGLNLFEYIKNNKNMPQNNIFNIIYQLASALKFLHSHNIIHCDLKLDNVIVTNDLKIKVIDFDLSIICNNNEGYVANSIFGTMQYIAPESYDLCVYSKKSDIWQLGIILYIMITNHFPHQTEISLINSYNNFCRQNIFKHIDLTIPKSIIVTNNYDVSLFYLLQKMLTFDDSKRINANNILKNISTNKKIENKCI